jgi:hypothetical protein
MNAKAVTPSTPTNLSDWTPPGWLFDDEQDPWSFEQVIEAEAKLVEDGFLDTKGRINDLETWYAGLSKPAAEDKRRIAKYRRKLSKGSEYTEIEAIVHNMKILRQCWNTDRGVWDLLELLAGEPFTTDPFWNMWSRLNPTVRLDGNNGTDGYDLSQWRGFAGVNGPHKDTKKWSPLCAEHGKEHKCAAIVPYRGDKWLWDHGMQADLILHFGRLHFHPVPGIQASSPAGPTIAPLWLPKQSLGGRRGIHPVAKRALRGETVRVPTKLTSPSGKPYIRDVLVTTGCSSKIADLFKLLSNDLP